MSPTWRSVAVGSLFLLGVAGMTAALWWVSRSLGLGFISAAALFVSFALARK